MLAEQVWRPGFCLRKQKSGSSRVTARAIARWGCLQWLDVDGLKGSDEKAAWIEASWCSPVRARKCGRDENRHQWSAGGAGPSNIGPVRLHKTQPGWPIARPARGADRKAP